MSYSRCSVVTEVTTCRSTVHCCAQSPFFKGGVGGLRVPNPLSPSGRDKSEGDTHNMSLRGVPKSRDDAAISALLCQSPLTNVILSFSEESRPPCPILSPLAGEIRVRGIYRWVAWSIRSKQCRGTMPCALLSVGVGCLALLCSVVTLTLTCRGSKF